MIPVVIVIVIIAVIANIMVILNFQIGQPCLTPSVNCLLFPNCVSKLNYHQKRNDNIDKGVCVFLRKENKKPKKKSTIAAA